MAKNFLGSIPLLVVGALVGLLPKVSLGAELTVCHGGCEHSTIQGAVDAAADGDTIFISGGTYAEHVTIQGKSLTIEGSGSNNTFVQGVLDGGPVFTLGAGSGPPYYEVDLSYLTVMGGEHVGGTQIGGGIQVRDGAYLHLSNATVTDNYANSGAGIGIMASVGPPSTLAQCSVTNNSGAVEGGGIYVQSGAS
ncbi:MAG TPA: hypothetical protein VMF64_10635, partial [Steroidobacteraceae bacterium]|nr:hypothetical protein [Steroidobacteraceae bacterium]